VKRECVFGKKEQRRIEMRIESPDYVQLHQEDVRYTEVLALLAAGKQVREFYVNKYSTAPHEDGSFAYPYKTFGAVATVIGDPVSKDDLETFFVVRAAPGVYDETVDWGVNRQIGIYTTEAFGFSFRIATQIVFGSTTSYGTSTKRYVRIHADDTKKFGSSQGPVLIMVGVLVQGSIQIIGDDGVGVTGNLYLQGCVIAEGLQGDPAKKFNRTFYLEFYATSFFQLNAGIGDVIDYTNVAGIRLVKAIDCSITTVGAVPARFDQHTLSVRTSYSKGVRIGSQVTSQKYYGFLGCNIGVEFYGPASSGYFDNLTLRIFIANATAWNGGASLTLIDSGFVPAVAGNWTVSPTNYRDALDQLAARVKALEP